MSNNRVKAENLGRHENQRAVKRRFKQVWNLALYFAIPAFSAVTPFVVFPALTSAYGASGLAAIAIGQSLGASAAVVAELGWSILGPQIVARSSVEQRKQIFQSAFATRLTALAVSAPIAVVASYFIAADHKAAAGLMAFAFSLAALSPSWFFIGCNRPILILVIEASPRFLMSVLCALLIMGGAPLEVYGLAIFVAALLTWLLTAWSTQQRLVPKWESFHRGIILIREHLPLTFGRMVSVLYTSLPVTLVAVASPPSAAAYAAADRLIRMAGTLLGGVPSRLQSWVGADPALVGFPRSRKSLVLNALYGAVAAIGFMVTAPWVAAFVFSGVVDFGTPLAAAGGFVIFGICVSRGFGLSLVAEGRPNWIAAANIGSAIVGVPTVFFLAQSWGAFGGTIGSFAAEVTGIAIQALVLFIGPRWRRPNDRVK